MNSAQQLVRPWLALSTLLTGLCVFLANPSQGQDKLDHQALVRETQRTVEEGGKLVVVWWMPEQYWQAITSKNPTVTQAHVDQLLHTVRPYTIIAVIAGDVGSFGGVTYNSEETLRASVTIRDTAGLSYSPLDESTIDPNTKNLLQSVKPVIANMLGPLGENMHFLLFPANDTNGRAIADPTKEGMFSVIVVDAEFKYRLPLGSVLPPKYDMKTGERFPGNYTYSPFTGSKLATENPN